MSNITGILSEDLATVFVINVSDGRNLTEYQTNLHIPSTQNFFQVLRYMVQNYLLSGFTAENSVNEWLNGYTADFFDEVADGNFYQGNDKDLIKKINAIFNYDTD